MSHPQFEEIMKVCDQYGMFVQLVTNASLLGNHRDLYLHPSLRKCSFSIQSSDYQTGIDPVAYIEEILAFCRKAANHHTVCEIRFWQSHPSPSSHSARILDYLKKNFCLTPARSDKNFRLGQNIYVDFAEEFQWPSLDQAEESAKGSCHGVRDQIGILSDGTVVPCCLDGNGMISLGNIYHENFTDILNGERALRMADGFRNGIITEELCLHCSYRLRFNK